MDGTAYPFDWQGETGPIIVDSFAGGGGASTGIERALGRGPDVAINHSAAALALHKANHPETRHLDSNIWDVHPLEVTGGRPVGLLWASPDCKHFSKAKGGALRDRNIRDLAWIVVRWAEEVRPDVIIMENVEEFETWCPVGDDGRILEWLKGETYRDWTRRFRAAGYRIQKRLLRGCDYGAPTIRRRLFIIARRDGRAIVWPKPTHGAPGSPGVRSGRLLPYRTAAECIDWTLPCPSIFDSTAEVMAKHGLRAVRPLATNTLARIARGMKRYVLEAERPFIVNLTHGGRTEDAAEPFRTITGAHRGEKAVVCPSLVSVAHGDSGGRREYPLDAPHGTVTAGGNTHALLAPSITRFNGGATGQDARDPLATVTANSWIKKPGGAAPLGVVAPMLTHLYTSNTAGGQGDCRLPIKTVTAGGGHSALVSPCLAVNTTGHAGTAADAPCATVTTGGHHALVSPVLTYAQHGGSVRDIAAPCHTITASGKDQNAVIAPTLIQTGYGVRPGQAPRCLDLLQPLGTAVAGGAKHAPVAAFLAQHNTGVVGHDAREPLSTIVGKGCTQTPVAAWFAKYYGTSDGAPMDEPAHTVTVRDRFGHMQADLAAPPYGPEHEARARIVAEFLRAHDAWSGGDLVTLEIDGATFVVIDIGMRMLTPRELYNAQGFPPDYVIEGVWQEDGTGEWAWHPFTKNVQVSCCGNSVCPDVAAALVEANCGHLVKNETKETAHG